MNAFLGVYQSFKGLNFASRLPEVWSCALHQEQIGPEACWSQENKEQGELTNDDLVAECAQTPTERPVPDSFSNFSQNHEFDSHVQSVVLNCTIWTDND